MMCWSIGDMSLSCANVISEHALVKDSVLLFMDSHFSAANARCFITPPQ